MAYLALKRIYSAYFQLVLSLIFKIRCFVFVTKQFITVGTNRGKPVPHPDIN